MLLFKISSVGFCKFFLFVNQMVKKYFRKKFQNYLENKKKPHIFATRLRNERTQAKQSSLKIIERQAA